MLVDRCYLIIYPYFVLLHNEILSQIDSKNNWSAQTERQMLLSLDDFMKDPMCFVLCTIVASFIHLT